MSIDIAWFPNYGHLMAGIFCLFVAIIFSVVSLALFLGFLRLLIFSSITFSFLVSL